MISREAINEVLEVYFKGMKVEIDEAEIHRDLSNYETSGRVSWYISDGVLSELMEPNDDNSEGGAEMARYYVLYEITVLDRTTGDIVVEKKVAAKNVTHAIFKCRLNEAIREKGYDDYYDVSVTVAKVEGSGFDLKK